MHFFKKKINSKSFTLVEALVVMAIVMALTSLLIPSLRKIISRTNALKCASNLKHIGMANALYADDFDDYHVPQWMASLDAPFSLGQTRWGYLREFRSYAEWDIVSNRIWMLPHDKACPEAVVRAVNELNVSNGTYLNTPPLLKTLFTYSHLAINGSKKLRGMHRNWIQNPSQLGNVGEGWGSHKVSSLNFVSRHDFRSNILFFDGHTESFETYDLEINTEKPWVDSNGHTLTEINNENAVY